MTIEIFSRSEFEAALPKGFWQYAGLDKGEHTYNISITDDILIHIRSSVDSSGFSADTGEDSIRAWLITSGGRPLGSKVQKYITRRPGWDKKLVEMLRTLWGRAQKAGYCKSCKQPNGVFVVKKEGRNKGKLFSQCGQCRNNFTWLEE